MSFPDEAVVLAGGQGTRLRDVLPGIPKVIAPISGRPFLHLLFDRLSSQGVTRVVLATGFDAETVEAAARAWSGPMTLSVSRERTPLGTGGATAQALEAIRGDRAWVFNGDSFCDVDLAGVAALASTAPEDAWIIATRVSDAARYGTVLLEDDRITAYVEKTGRSDPGWISVGIYILPKTSLTAGCFSIERDIFPDWAATGRLRAARVHGRFLDIGTPESLTAAATFFS